MKPKFLQQFLKEHRHAIPVRCKMLKMSLNQEKSKYNEAVYLQFIYRVTSLRLNTDWRHEKRLLSSISVKFGR